MPAPSKKRKELRSADAVTGQQQGMAEPVVPVPNKEAVAEVTSAFMVQEAQVALSRLRSAKEGAKRRRGGA